MLDLIILGAGPAGLSAAIYALRANVTVKIIGKPESATQKAHLIENYFGVPSITGESLLELGRSQVISLHGEIIDEEIVGVTWDNTYTITTTKNTYQSKAIIFATGSRRTEPKLEGFSQFQQKGISYCAVCDGFFYRGRPVGVLGSGEYALHEAEALVNIAASVTVFTNGEPVTATFPNNIKLVTEPIKALRGGGRLDNVLLENGESIPLSGLFVAVGSASSSDLAKKLGIITTDNGKIKVNEKMATNAPGAFAAGDCTSSIQQISVAVGEGATAALSAIDYIRSTK